MSQLKRLYIFTGKGGVGKTTCAFSFAKHLKDSGKKVAYAHIASASIDKDLKSTSEFRFDDLEVMDLEIKDATADYVSMKLKSKIVGALVVKTPFFKSLVSMIPGFNYLIYLGKIIHRLKDDSDLHIIFDSPSSGHALTMLNATNNFGEIFNSGAVFDDTKVMKEFLFQEDFIKVNIISIPTQMSKSESIELEQEILTISSNIRTQTIFNNVIDESVISQSDSLPQFLQEKINNEKEVLNNTDKVKIPHSNAKSNEQIALEIIPFMQKLI